MQLFQNQNALRILPVFTKLKSNFFGQSYTEKQSMPPPLLFFNEFGGTYLGG
jgi:hypothetical protein